MDKALIFHIFVPLAIAVMVLSCGKKSGSLSDQALSRSKEVLSGDSFRAEDGRVIKLIGVDIEETIKGMKLEYARYEVSNNAKTFLMNTLQGKWIRIEYEAPKMDRSGSVRAYIWLENGELVNELVVKNGWSIVHIGYPFSKMELLQKAQKQARIFRRGIWKYITKEGI